MEEGLSYAEIMANLSEPEQVRFKAVTELFESDGWKILQEYATARGFEQGVSGANAGGTDEHVAVRCARAFGKRAVWQEIEEWPTMWHNSFEGAAASRIDSDDDGEDEILY